MKAKVVKRLKSVSNWIAVIAIVVAVIFGVQIWTASGASDDNNRKLEIWRNCMQFSVSISVVINQP